MAWVLRNKIKMLYGLNVNPNISLKTAKGICFSSDGNRIYLHGFLQGQEETEEGSVEVWGGGVVQFFCATPWECGPNYIDPGYLKTGGSGCINHDGGALIDFHQPFYLTTCDSEPYSTNYTTHWNVRKSWDITSISSDESHPGKMVVNSTVMGLATFPVSRKYAELDRSSKTLFLYAPLTNYELPWEFLESYTLDDCESLSGLHVASDESYILTVDQATKRIIKITLPTPGSLAGATHEIFKELSVDQDDIEYSAWDIWDIASNAECTLVTLIAMSPEVSWNSLQPFAVATYSIEYAVQWPAYLPGPSKEGIKIVPNPCVKSRSPQRGPKELRRWGSGKPDTLTCSFRLFNNHPVHGKQIDKFKSFLKDDLCFGVNWIDAPWLCSVFGYSNHYIRIMGYVPRSGFNNVYSDFSVTFLVQEKGNCPANTSWPS